MRTWLLIALLCLPGCLRAQAAPDWEVIDWQPTYALQLSDFRGEGTQIGAGDTYSLYVPSAMDFAFRMSNAEFMFTKNFNPMVHCRFDCRAAVLVAPDSALADDLLQFARYTFDLSELYARKFRAGLHAEKGAFSGVDFYRPLYEDLQRDHNVRHARAATTTQLGQQRSELAVLHAEVITEMEALADFCKTCKPPKRKSK